LRADKLVAGSVQAKTGVINTHYQDNFLANIHKAYFSFTILKTLSG